MEWGSRSALVGSAEMGCAKVAHTLWEAPSPPGQMPPCECEVTWQGLCAFEAKVHGFKFISRTCAWPPRPPQTDPTKRLIGAWAGAVKVRGAGLGSIGAWAGAACRSSGAVKDRDMLQTTFGTYVIALRLTLCAQSLL
eukprot:scaffold189676_cov17-Tisochrysis_lutea.AAC.2